RDINGGDAEALMQRLDLAAHDHAQLGIQVGKRLVEQKHLRVAHDGAAHGYALALAAGQLARITLEQVGEVEDLGGPANTFCYLGLGPTTVFQGEAHVGGDGHVRIERVVLEHHGDVPVLWL